MTPEEFRKLRDDVDKLTLNVSELMPMVRELYQARPYGGSPRVPALQSLRPSSWPVSSRKAGAISASAVSFLWALGWAVLEYLQR